MAYFLLFHFLNLFLLGFVSISLTSDQLSFGLKDEEIRFKWSKVTVTLYESGKERM